MAASVEIKKAGELLKTGESNSSYKKRWFVLTKNSVEYYKAKEDKTPAGTIMIHEVICATVSDEDATGDVLPFEIRTHERVYRCAAEQSSNRLAWVNAINHLLPPGRLERAKQWFGANIRTGWLEKEGGSFKSLKKRWVVLTKDKIEYFKTKDAKECAGNIETKNVRDVYHPDIKDKQYQGKFPFFVVLPDRTFVFLAESDTDRQGWMRAIDKAKPQPGTKQFGVELKDIVARYGSNGIPAFIDTALTILQEKALKLEGILRLSGNNKEIQRMKKAIDLGQDPHLEAVQDPHEIAGLVKLYLRDLPAPLLTYPLYDAFLRCRGIEDPGTRLAVLQHLMQLVPVEEKALTRRLFEICENIVSHRAENKMTSENTAIVLGPNLLRRENESEIDMMAGAAMICNITKEMLDFGSQHVFAKCAVDPPYCALGRSLYAYSPPEAHLLSFTTNGIVVITKKSLGEGWDGWWEGMFEQRVGYFPLNYVEVFCNLSVDTPPEVKATPPPLPSTPPPVATATPDVEPPVQNAVNTAAAAAAPKPKPKPQPKPKPRAATVATTSPAPKPKPHPNARRSRASTTTPDLATVDLSNVEELRKALLASELARNDLAERVQTLEESVRALSAILTRNDLQ